MIRSINFIEKESCASQQTLVAILSKYSFYFSPVSKYDNRLFYLIIRKEKQNKLIDLWNKYLGKWKHFDKTNYSDSKLCITIDGYDSNEIFEPIVCNREDIEKIISDNYSTYIGKGNL